MSGKKSLLVDKSKMPLAMGIAFVAFTTQFGGGFASGAQIYQYFINYGIWCLLMPLITQARNKLRLHVIQLVSQFLTHRFTQSIRLTASKISQQT